MRGRFGEFPVVRLRVARCRVLVRRAAGGRTVSRGWGMQLMLAVARRRPRVACCVRVTDGRRVVLSIRRRRHGEKCLGTARGRSHDDESRVPSCIRVRGVSRDVYGSRHGGIVYVFTFTESRVHDESRWDGELVNLCPRRVIP